MSKSSDRADRAARASAALAAQRAKERRRNLLMIVGVVVAMLVIVGGGFLISSLNNGGSKGPAATSTTATGAAAAAAGGLVVGPDTAPHKVVIYEDFICPFCGMFEQTSHTDLASLAESGKVQVNYRPFHFLPEDYSEQALEVFEAVLAQGDNTVTKAFHDELYTTANQPQEQGPYPSQSDIVDLAVKAGASKTAVEAALKDGTAKAAAAAATKDAGDAKVQSTPTVLLDGKAFTDGQTVQELAANLVKAVS